MKMIIKKFNTENLTASIYHEAGTGNYLDAALFTDINSYLPGALLPKVDIASMTVGLEARSPLLDHTFMELTAQIPPSLKFNGFTTKYIFKQALKNLLPNVILNRKKRGFSVPLEHWFKNDLREFAHDTLLRSNVISKYFSILEVKRLLDEHTTTRANHSRKLWPLLWLSLWHDRFFSR